jgi:hypothetical protein
LLAYKIRDAVSEQDFFAQFGRYFEMRECLMGSSWGGEFDPREYYLIQARLREEALPEGVVDSTFAIWQHLRMMFDEEIEIGG